MIKTFGQLKSTSKIEKNIENDTLSKLETKGIRLIPTNFDIRMSPEVVAAFANLIEKSNNQSELIKVQNMINENMLSQNKLLIVKNIDCQMKNESLTENLLISKVNYDFLKKKRNNILRIGIPILLTSLVTNFFLIKSKVQ